MSPLTVEMLNVKH